MTESKNHIESSDGSAARQTRVRRYLRRYLEEATIFAALLRGVECELIASTQPWPGPVVDLGCGDGFFGSLVAAQPWSIGLDPDRRALTEAASRGAYQLLLRADSTKIPIRSGSVGTIVSNSVLEHIPELEPALTEIHRALEPGGRLIATAPSHLFSTQLLGSELLRRLGLRAAGIAYGRWFNEHSKHYHAISLEQWRDLLTRVGFEFEGGHYYLDEPAMRVFDVAHYVSVPRLLMKKLTGSWVPIRIAPWIWFLERLLHPFADSSRKESGPYLSFVARKR